MSPYIARLRAAVGHDRLHVASAGVIISADDGRLLVGRHADSGRWSPIGGAIELGETPEDAAIREAREETGCSIEIDRLLTVVGGTRYRVTYANDDEVEYVISIYAAHVVAGEPCPDGDEVLELRWVHPHDLRTLELTEIAVQLLADTGIVPEVPPATA